MENWKIRKVIVFGICVLLLECALAFLFIGFMNYAESLYYVSQVVNCVIVACGVIYAIWQYYLSLRDSNRNSNIVRVQKAIDLAQFYKDNILEKYTPIRYVFDKSKISEILSKVPQSDMNLFDSKELNQYLNDADTEELRTIQSSDAFFSAILSANIIYNMNFKINKEIQSIKDNGDNTKTITFSIDKEPVITAFFRNYIDETLNNMEFFAMHFSHNAADSSVVYQSLHQSYIEMVEALYYFIAAQNTDSVNKYYTNTIDLYKRWKEEQDKMNQQRRDLEPKLQTRGTVIE